jgi:hypothetical protein
MSDVGGGDFDLDGGSALERMFENDITLARLGVCRKEKKFTSAFGQKVGSRLDARVRRQNMTLKI